MFPLPLQMQGWFDNVIQNYKRELYGYRFDYDLAPEFHYGTSARDGCRRLVPAVALQVQI